MHALITQLQQGIIDCRLADTELLVAVSGGADSVALLLGLQELAKENALHLQVAHVNHQLRGEQSDSDSQFVASLAASLGVPCHVDSVDIAIMAKEWGIGIEEAARDARFAFFRQTARQTNTRWIALAHTADDQAETILHHIVRGTGIAGLRGMPAVRELEKDIAIVRPLLRTSRKTVLNYLQIRNQEFRQDGTNDDTEFTRNRIRHVLLPMLETQFNPQVRQALLRLGTQAGEVQTLIDDQIRSLCAVAVASQQDEICRLVRDRLVGKTRYLLRAFFARLWQQQNWPRQRMGFAEWDRLVDLLHNEETAVLPGNVEVRTRGDLFVLRKRS